jgi:hypothetical protein
MKDFLTRFKEAAFLHKNELIASLICTFDSPPFHFSRYVLRPYYQACHSMPSSLDIDCASKILKARFDESSLFIVDYDRPYRGGYPVQRIKGQPQGIDVNKKPYLNWNDIHDKIKSDYFTNLNLLELEALSIATNFNIFEDREPKNLKEKAMLLNGNLQSIEYKFFNKSEVLNLYSYLICFFFDGFHLRDKISNGNIKKYQKDSSNEWVITLSVDYREMSKQLDSMYLELPNINIEIASKKLNGFIKEDVLLTPDSQSSLYRVGLNYYIGNMDDNRLGISYERKIILVKECFFAIQVQSFYITKYMRYIESILDKM